MSIAPTTYQTFFGGGLRVGDIGYAPGRAPYPCGQAGGGGSIDTLTSSGSAAAALVIHSTGVGCRRDLVAGGREAGHEPTEFGPGLLEEFSGASHHELYDSGSTLILEASERIEDPDLPQRGGRSAMRILDLQQLRDLSCGSVRHGVALEHGHRVLGS
jgi:hypothetical protein